MDQKDVERLNLKNPVSAWAILTPSPHLNDYPVDDLHALYLVYTGQCWQPPLSRTQSAWRRERSSDGKFKYAVIDARFEYKGRSLYERAILYVGNEVAVMEEILNGTAPTYYALKPETLARNYDWSLCDAGIGAWVDLSLSHHDIVESLKISHSSTPKC